MTTLDTTRFGRSRNVSFEPEILPPVPLNSSTSTTIAVLTEYASTLILTNDGNQDAFIKLQRANIDNDKKGFVLYKGTTTDIDLDRANYPGEVSGIARLGTTLIYATVL